MSCSDVEDLARRMYDECPTVKPDWEQLGNITRSVWHEMAAARLGHATAAAAPARETRGQASLF